MTQILPATSQGIAQAASLLREGALVAIPTETVYGLAADARNPHAVAGIFEAKDRPSFNPLIVHVPDLTAAEAIAVFPDPARVLATQLWPGPLTLVLPLRPDAGISDLVTAGGDTIAIRIPAHPVAQQLLRAAAIPLAAPSANRSGRISPSRAAHVTDPDGGLDGRIAAVLDGGPCEVGLESTIIGWQGETALLLRPGGLDAETIEHVMQRPLLRPRISIAAQAPEDSTGQITANSRKTHKDSPSGTATPTAPGQLTSHYAPKAPLRINAQTARPGETFIAFGPAGADGLTLSASRDLRQAAAALFETLRRADRLGRPIAIAPIPEQGLGLAINDRLRRAAAPRD